MARLVLIGYARVSTQAQNLDRQIAMLKVAGCERIFSEKKSGKDTAGRRELSAAINALGEGDILILAEWDRATRSMYDGISIMTQVAKRGALLKALDRTWLDLTTPIGKGILAFLSALAEDERERILARAAEGRKAAHARGTRFGRPLKLTAHQQQEVIERLKAGQESHRAIARSYNVNHNTIARIKRSAGL